MKTSDNGGVTRRDMLKTSGQVAVASALAGVALPHVHAAENNTIQVVLIGCGGRGTGAAGNALSVKNGPIKLVAMADVFPERLAGSYKNLKGTFGDKVDVPEERKFIGFDAYKKAMDCLNKGDVAIFATPPAFRWVHFGYAIEKGLNVFQEKPVTVDGPSTRRFLKLAEESEKLNLKVGVGLMCRHCTVRGELYNRIKDGQIGDLVLLRAYRMAGPTGFAFTGPKPDGISEVMYQIKQFHAFLWASGGAFSDFLIHNIDECCWMKDAWPVKAQGSGGRHYRGANVDQNFDTYVVEYTFADGSKMFLEGRTINGCKNEFASYAHGTKGSAVISTSGHTPCSSRIYKGQNHVPQDLVWSWGEAKKEPNPYQLEWDHLIADIREDKPHNEARRGAEASLITAMGRFSCHTGQLVTRDQMLAHDVELAPDVDKLTPTGPAPLRFDEQEGRYPVPRPGILKNREYEVPQQ